MPVAAEASTAGFVQRSGEHLTIDGVPWRAIGVNLWDMDPGKVLGGDITGCWYQHADLDTYLDESFARIRANTHANTVRTFGFRMMYTAGGRDWSSTDKLVHYARKHNLRLVPVFGDQYGACGSPAKDASWYREGYRTIVEQPWGRTYRDYVIEAVRRYRSEPAIAFWQLMNEATAGSDTGALVSFSREMAAAIRQDAGDTAHLVNLGTAGGGTIGNELPAFADLLDCPSGGCNDLAEAHVFNAATPLPGLPMPSAVDATLAVANAGGARFSSAVVRPAIDGWTKLTFTTPVNGRPWSAWSLSLATPAGGAWSAMVDDVVVQTAAGPQLFTFEAGTQGFSSPDASLSRTTSAAHGGLASLRAAVGQSGAARVVRIDGPPAADITSLEAWVRLDFRAQRPATGASIAANLHAATVARGAPFVLGEIGYQAAVPGLARCAGHRSLAERAAAVDEMLRLHADPVYGGDGGLIWDWKDPAILSTAPDGTAIADPTVDCWTVTPGDPVEAVLRAHADALAPVTPLPPPAPLPSFAHSMVVFAGPADEIGRGSRVRFLLRLTRGGDAAAGVRVVAGGGCHGSGMTDGLGLADFTCVVIGLGQAVLTVAPDPASCACSLAPAEFPVTIKRALTLEATADVAAAGQPVTLRLAVTDPSGASVQGVRWRVPECGLEGTVAGSSNKAAFTAICPASVDWRGSTLLRFMVDADAATAPGEVGFVGLRFDRIYFDARSRECIGLAPASGWVGATARAGACSRQATGSFADWFLYQVPGGARAQSFTTAGPVLVASIDAREGRRIDGVFSLNDPMFAATVMRRDGAHVLTSF